MEDEFPRCCLGVPTYLRLQSNWKTPGGRYRTTFSAPQGRQRARVAESVAVSNARTHSQRQAPKIGNVLDCANCRAQRLLKVRPAEAEFLELRVLRPITSMTLL